MTTKTANPYNENTFFYDEQLKAYIVQFMAVFSGMQTRIGKNDFGSATNLAYVPIRYGTADRVAQAILAENTQNKPIRLPTMAATLIGIELALDKMKGTDTKSRYTTFPVGGSFPDDLSVVELMMPIPYEAFFELSIMSSNTDQQLQIIEQILLLFNPTLQLQLSDDPHDWKKLTMLQLNNITLEERIPAGLENRVIVSSFTFQATVMMSPPAQIKKNFIKSIKLRLEAVRHSQDVLEVVNDVSRELPEYSTIIDADELDFPKQ